MDKKKQAILNRKRGKNNEKALEKLLDAFRVGIFGGEDLTDKDRKYSFEAKSRKSFVASKWFSQCEKNSKGKIPILIVHIHGNRHEDDFVIFKLKYIKEFLK